MATKANRKAAKRQSGGAPRSYSQLYKSDNRGVQQQIAQPAVVQSVSPVAAPVRESDFDWDREYSHIYRDLRNLGIVTAVLTGAIIVAGFIF